jgi:hypothetical protein
LDAVKLKNRNELCAPYIFISKLFVCTREFGKIKKDNVLNTMKLVVKLEKRGVKNKRFKNKCDVKKW